jgi:tetratricopeptide (TPR) repeat protein
LLPAFSDSMEDSSASAPSSDRAAGIAQARALLGRNRLTEALSLTASLLTDRADDRDLLYVHAVTQRLLGQLPEALTTLSRMELLYPLYPRLYQERGHCHAAARAAHAAILAFERAVQLNPSLPSSWSMLEALYAATGQSAQSARAREMVRQLGDLPPEIVTAFSMYADGEAEQAEKLIRHFIQTRGNHLEALRLLAKIALDFEIADDASVLLEYILSVAPDHRVARYEYVLVLMKQYRHSEAAIHIKQLLDLEPDHFSYRLTHATLLCATSDFARALPEFHELMAVNPHDVDTHLAFGHALQTLGDYSGAISTLRRAIDLQPACGDAYWALANLKTYEFTAQELMRMRVVEASQGLRLRDRIHVCFALGKALEDHADYAGSFQYYERGNALKKSSVRYIPEAIERMAALQKSVCTTDFFQARRLFGCQSADPIFIVGVPRSGSTLIEQILASHSQVQGTMELGDIPRLVARLQGRATTDAGLRYPGILTELSADDCRQFGEKYLADTRVYRDARPRFIDKMPNNFRHIGLIHLILPNARIIDARRNALACCFSNFKQLYASGQQFAYCFEDLARYYRAYLEFMAHWDRVLPGQVLKVQHEHVVDDLENQVRRLLDFCGLEFERGCVDFHENARPVHTVSAQQVRRPINRDGLDQWKHFEPWLAPLRERLADLT